MQASQTIQFSGRTLTRYIKRFNFRVLEGQNPVVAVPDKCFSLLYLVRREGLEPPRFYSLAPQPTRNTWFDAYTAVYDHILDPIECHQESWSAQIRHKSSDGRRSFGRRPFPAPFSRSRVADSEQDPRGEPEPGGPAIRSEAFRASAEPFQFRDHRRKVVRLDEELNLRHHSARRR
jgi:hypothetical protein